MLQNGQIEALLAAEIVVDHPDVAAGRGGDPFHIVTMAMNGSLAFGTSRCRRALIPGVYGSRLTRQSL